MTTRSLGEGCFWFRQHHRAGVMPRASFPVIQVLCCHPNLHEAVSLNPRLIGRNEKGLFPALFDLLQDHAESPVEFTQKLIFVFFSNHGDWDKQDPACF